MTFDNILNIIVLLILAGVTIASLMGKNGIVTRAKQAKEEHIIAAEKEQIGIAYLSCKTKLNESMGEERVTAEQLEEELLKNNKNVETTDNETDEGYYIYVTFNETEHTYVVDKDGNIELIEYDEKLNSIDRKLVRQDIDTSNSLDTIMNPDRGWYTTYTMVLGGNNEDMQITCTRAKQEKSQVISLRINIGVLSGNVNADGIDKDFTQEQINVINENLQIIRDNNLNVIMRFAYDTDGHEYREPKSFDTIKKHILQLRPVFEKNKDIISTLEAGFLGQWGEMHDAGDYQADEYYKMLIETLLENTPSELKINVRKPHFYKLVVGSLDNSQRRLGIFNDGYFGSATDLETFDNDITRNEFVNWMQTQGQYTLYEGETGMPGGDQDQKYSDSEFVLSEMPKTHTACLNNQWYDRNT